jgi:hypothetical protein
MVMPLPPVASDRTVSGDDGRERSCSAAVAPVRLTADVARPPEIYVPVAPLVMVKDVELAVATLTFCRLYIGGMTPSMDTVCPGVKPLDCSHSHSSAVSCDVQ